MTDTPTGGMPVPIVPGLTDLRVFARGGYATVYQATQISVGREVAVKVENRTLDSERDQARFLREARAAGRMSSHPHVVDLFDVGVTVDQHPYLIMELCDGSYAERMRSSPLGPVEARDLGIKIADALAHSHGAGVLHRDVKPANILYSHFNSAVLADFGLAVLAEARDASVTLEVLTPAYAPPEMFSHSPPSPAVDVYALCATLYAVMHGRPPRWQSERNPSLVTVLEMFNQPLPALPGVPDELIDVLRFGMANDPAERPSALELHDLLANLPFGSPSAPVSGVPTSGSPISGAPVGGSLVSGGPSRSGLYGTGHPAPRPRSRTPAPAFPVAGGGDGAGSSVASECWRSPPRPPPGPGWRAVARRPTRPLGDPGRGTGDRAAARLRVRRRGADRAAQRCPLPARAGVLRPGAHPRRPRRGGPGPVRRPAYLGDVRRGHPAGAARRRGLRRGDRRRAGTAGVQRHDVPTDHEDRRAGRLALEVLPPVDGNVDRVYRCLAGRGVDALTAPTLTGR